MIMVAPNAKVESPQRGNRSIGRNVGMYAVNALFSTLISRILGYSVIYGSFAAVFLFLLWVYMIWVVILGAVEVSYVHQYQPDKGTIANPISPA